MSAYKTAYIKLSEAEYKRLREAEEQLRLNILLSAGKEKDFKSKDRSIYENMMGTNQENERYFRNLVVDIDHEIGRVENAASAWVEDQVSQMRREFSENQKVVQQQAGDQISIWMQQANQQIQEKEAVLQAYWSDQEAKLARYENRLSEYQNQAIYWIRKDQEILDFIFSAYALDASAANHLELHRQYLNQAIQQYNLDFFDIAAAAGFQIFIALSNIHSQLEVEQAIKVVQYQQLVDKVGNLRNYLACSKTVHAMDGEGNELPELIDVDYWVEGQWSGLVEKVDLIEKEIFSGLELDREALASYIKQIEDFSNQLIDLVTRARMMVLASQLRFNVAQIVVQALESQGFFLEKASYSRDDYRESFTATTCNLSGNEVLVTIDPEPGLDEGGKLHIQSLDAAAITEHELLQRNFEIFSAIQENGIQVSDIQEVAISPVENNRFHRPRILQKPDSLETSKEKRIHGRY